MLECHVHIINLTLLGVHHHNFEVGDKRLVCDSYGLDLETGGLTEWGVLSRKRLLSGPVVHV